MGAADLPDNWSTSSEGSSSHDLPTLLPARNARGVFMSRPRWGRILRPMTALGVRSPLRTLAWRKELRGPITRLTYVARYQPSHREVVEWVRRTTRAQGLPEKVTDPTILRQVAVLLRPSLARLPAPKARDNVGSTGVRPSPAASPETVGASLHAHLGSAAGPPHIEHLRTGPLRRLSESELDSLTHTLRTLLALVERGPLG